MILLKYCYPSKLEIYLVFEKYEKFIVVIKDTKFRIMRSQKARKLLIKAIEQGENS